MWIDEVVTGLLDLYATKDVYELYEALEISIVYLEEDSILLQGHDALYNRNYLDREVVFLRGGLSLEYERFILAHELGHALLHTHLVSNTFHSLTNLDKLEKQASYFAVRLLDVKLDSIALEGFTIEQIASTLELPMECLEIIREMEEGYGLNP
ncbi:Metallopeptidase ImmA [Clostridium formicaceticum]|nr:Metallopeptidase ImmA [Clostridium formicaceticum]